MNCLILVLGDKMLLGIQYGWTSLRLITISQRSFSFSFRIILFLIINYSFIIFLYDSTIHYYIIFLYCIIMHISISVRSLNVEILMLLLVIGIP